MSDSAETRAFPLLRRIWTYLTPGQRLLLLAVSCANVLAGFATTAPAIVVGNIVNALLHSHGSPSISLSIIELAVLLVVFALLNLFVHVSLHSVTPKIEVTFRHQQVLRQLQTPINEDDQRYSAEINSVISNGTKGASDLVRLTFGDLFPAGAQVIWAVVLMFHQEWIVGVLMLMAAPAGYVLIRLQLRSQSKIRQRIAKEKARLDGSLTELLQGKPVVRSLYAAEAESERIRSDAQNLADVELEHHRAMGFFDAAKYLTESMFGVVVVLIGVGLAERSTITAGGVLTLYLLYTQFALPLRDIHRMRDQAGEVENQCAMMFDILDEPLDPYFLTEGQTVSPNSAPDILEIVDVSKSYRSDHRPAIKAVSMSIPTGSFIGLCGPAGSGKSTLLKCVAGIIVPDTGAIRLYETPLSELEGRSVAGVIAYAPQTPYLLAGSIRANVMFGLDRLASDDEITAALEAVGVWNEVQEMPGGLDHELGEAGRGVSGGQAQRIVLARLLLRRPQILLLDEATSAMDNLNEAAIMAYLEQVGVTIVAIAHRLSTLRNADVIYVMESGRVVQKGEYPDLAASEGLFKDLLEASAASSAA
jgi:ATP-binding cassette subfamily B protein